VICNEEDTDVCCLCVDCDLFVVLLFINEMSRLVVWSIAYDETITRHQMPSVDIDDTVPC